MYQAHERARQGRLRYQFMKEISYIRDKSVIKSGAETKDESSERAAVIKIQKIWRGYVARCKIRVRRLEEMLLIGIYFFINEKR